jgi:protein-S-isoprenylcysteine O-methyltransferase Ste14
MKPKIVAFTSDEERESRKVKKIKVMLISILVGTFIGMLLIPDQGPGLEVARVLGILIVILLTWLLYKSRYSKD